MTATWLSIRVELIGSRDTELWPHPGRLIAVGPAHTLAALARAISVSLGRWDLSPELQFIFGDGSVSGQIGSAVNHPAAVLPADSLDLETTTVASVVGPGDEFKFVFDAEAVWTHRCLVGSEQVDPMELFDAEPPGPTAYRGWGSVPDQHGREWLDNDGASPIPPRPPTADRMLQSGWPNVPTAMPQVDIRDLRAAMYSGDAEPILAIVATRDVSGCLQMAGSALLRAHRNAPSKSKKPITLLTAQLMERGGSGDRELIEQLRAATQQKPLEGRELEIDLNVVATSLDNETRHCLLNVTTGECLPGDYAHSYSEGDPGWVDFDNETDEWMRLDGPGSRVGWEDMADFAANVRGGQLRRTLENAIEGRGAFRRFKDVVHREGVAEQWYAFSSDREMGRARALLAEAGIRPIPPVIPG